MEVQYQSKEVKFFPKKEEIYSIYLVGDAGALDVNGRNKVLEVVGNKIKKATKNSALIYLGDNVYQKGFPKKNNKNRKKAEKY